MKRTGIWHYFDNIAFPIAFGISVTKMLRVKVCLHDENTRTLWALAIWLGRLGCFFFLWPPAWSCSGSCLNSLSLVNKTLDENENMVNLRSVSLWSAL